MDTQITQTIAPNIQEQLPQVKRITRLDELRRITPPEPPVGLKKKFIPQKKRTSLIFPLTAGILFLAILCFELTVIYKYDRLNKRLYQISSSLKNDKTALIKKLNYINKAKLLLRNNQRGLQTGFLSLASRHKILQFKMERDRDNYKSILLADSAKIRILEGDMSVLNTRIVASNAQNEVLAEELNKKNEFIKELADRIIYNIEQQQILVKENLKLKKKHGVLLRKVIAMQSQKAEGIDVNQREAKSDVVADKD